MPREIVTSENREEYMEQKLAEKAGKKKKHESENLPEVTGSEVAENYKERTFPNAQSMGRSLTREISAELQKEKGWNQSEAKFYGHDMESPPKNIHDWKHYITTFSHPEKGEHHVTVSKDKKGFSIHRYKKSKKK